MTTVDHIAILATLCRYVVSLPITLECTVKVLGANVVIAALPSDGNVYNPGFPHSNFYNGCSVRLYWIHSTFM